MSTAFAIPRADHEWAWYPELLGTPVPRYTSYPTAAEFTDGFDGEALGSALDRVTADAPVSLYLHIPYCHEICWYCGCNTGAANRTGRLDGYLKSLRDEIALAGARLGGRGRVRRVAFGGGSPNAIAPAQFDELIDAVARHFTLDDPVLSVEIDPRGFDADWADALGRNRVSRASLGVQTLVPRIQAAIGRVQPVETVHGVMQLLRDAGLDSINFDLMYGLPGQTNDDLIETLDTALAMHPDRLAIFGYAHVPHLIPRQRRIDATALPDARMRFSQAGIAHAQLIGEGFVPVGFDHFAKPGDALARAAASGTLRRNFQGFTEDQADILIGLGASAISAFPDRLLQNEKNAGRYRARIDARAFAVNRGVLRDREDRVRGTLIEQLLTCGTAEIPATVDLLAEIERLKPFEARRLVRLRGRTIDVPPHALPYARTIAAIFDRHRKASATRFSAAV
ncbi:oxygen-independent coproporphyrinogen III oxidase [Sphingomonas psychrotolerans]|uniref:Coproporphyrinogen-III oxidase n=1 Tax=Sphingomonas psychrotolerans TaxID=1327635 RepID=A0ABU3NB58_9SPHN|nr:oxygen-independent coproporphyrinogen III oxidase [Sphingomonas psychrotolerans]MDT8761027.1 oxygen-independent coproporphyrinogen III oxidase [Sphingomonas psychrotolerans]